MPKIHDEDADIREALRVMRRAVRKRAAELEKHLMEIAKGQKPVRLAQPSGLSAHLTNIKVPGAVAGDDAEWDSAFKDMRVQTPGMARRRRQQFDAQAGGPNEMDGASNLLNNKAGRPRVLDERRPEFMFPGADESLPMSATRRPQHEGDPAELKRPAGTRGDDGSEDETKPRRPLNDAYDNGGARGLERDEDDEITEDDDHVEWRGMTVPRHIAEGNVDDKDGDGIPDDVDPVDDRPRRRRMNKSVHGGRIDGLPIAPRMKSSGGGRLDGKRLTPRYRRRGGRLM